MPSDTISTPPDIHPESGSATGYPSIMLNPTPGWKAFEREDEAAAYYHLSYAEALDRFERLWQYAREVNPALGEDWEEDLGADLALARVLNGLPPCR